MVHLQQSQTTFIFALPPGVYICSELSVLRFTNIVHPYFCGDTLTTPQSPSYCLVLDGMAHLQCYLWVPSQTNSWFPLAVKHPANWAAAQGQGTWGEHPEVLLSASGWTLTAEHSCCPLHAWATTSTAISLQALRLWLCLSPCQCLWQVCCLLLLPSAWPLWSRNYRLHLLPRSLCSLFHQPIQIRTSKVKYELLPSHEAGSTQVASRAISCGRGFRSISLSSSSQGIKPLFWTVMAHRDGSKCSAVRSPRNSTLLNLWQKAPKSSNFWLAAYQDVPSLAMYGMTGR